MPIENRNLTKGTKLMGRYHKQSFSCEVVENTEGKQRYRLQDGQEFKSPSAAGKAITGHACDGWVFWSVQTEAILATPETQIPTDTNQTGATEASKDVASVEKVPKKTGVFLVPNQKGVPEGQIRWFCRECGKSFIVSAVEIPGICPAKHQAK